MPPPPDPNNPYARFVTNPYTQFVTPSTDPAVPPVALDNRSTEALKWAGTRAINAAAETAGVPRLLSDIPAYIANLTGMDAEFANKAIRSNFAALASRSLPPATEYKNLVYDKLGVPRVNTPGRAGPVIDETVEAVIPNVLMPGSFLRNFLPTAFGSLASQAGAEISEGSKWGPLASILMGVTTGGGTAAAQNVLGNVGRGFTNLFPNVEKAKIKAIATALERDLTTGPAFQQKHADLGEGALAIEAGGPNMRSMMRNAVSQPGQGRTLSGEAFDARGLQADDATLRAINESVSNLPPMSTRVATLDTERAAASRPAYEAAGVPHRPEMTETMVPGKPVKKMVPILPGARAQTEITVPGEPVLQRSFNAPEFTSPALERELAGGHVKSAIAAARLLPDYKYVPANSMIMIDKAVKNLNGMEREAIRAGNGTRAHDLKGARQDLEAAISAVNPKYKEALAAFSDPSNLIDAAELGKNLFKGKAQPDEVSRRLNSLPADQRVEFRGGVADDLRTKAGATDARSAAERVWMTGDESRERLARVLGPWGNISFANRMENLVNAAKTARDVNAGSRTAPMLAEAADSAKIAGGAANILAGRVWSGSRQILGDLVDRIGSGKTEAVNKAIAEALTSKDPNTIGLIASLAEKQRAAMAVTKSNRFSAVGVGATSPMIQMADTLRQYNEKRAGGR